MLGHVNGFVTQSCFVKGTNMPKGENNRKKKTCYNWVNQKFQQIFEYGPFL